MLAHGTIESDGDAIDQTLMQRVSHDNCRDSFTELVNRWDQRIRSYCYRLCGNYADAEDLCQEVFQKIFERRAQYKPSGKFSNFVWTITANHCRDHERVQRKRRHSPLPSATTDGDPEQEATWELDIDTRESIQSIVWQLPIHYREVIVLRHYQGLKFHQIAAFLQLPRGTVASRMAKALTLLKKEFARKNILPS